MKHNTKFVLGLAIAVFVASVLWMTLKRNKPAPAVGLTMVPTQAPSLAGMSMPPRMVRGPDFSDRLTGTPVLGPQLTGTPEPDFDLMGYTDPDDDDYGMI